MTPLGIKTKKKCEWDHAGVSLEQAYWNYCPLCGERLPNRLYTLSKK